jgi:hypothetical protein
MSLSRSDVNTRRAIFRAAVFATGYVLAVLAYLLNTGFERPAALIASVAAQAYVCALVAGLLLRLTSRHGWFQTGLVWVGLFLLWRVIVVLASYANSF